MRQPSCVYVLLGVTIVVSAAAPQNRADDVVSTGQRRTLARSAGDSVARACGWANCATVLAVRHGDLGEFPPPVHVQGPLSRQPPFGPFNPHVPPITQPSFLVQKHSDVWVIEVRLRDGTIQSIEQSYPALFQVGDEVLVDGDRIRVPD
jgi:hypothetical protein